MPERRAAMPVRGARGLQAVVFFSGPWDLDAETHFGPARATLCPRFTSRGAAPVWGCRHANRRRLCERISHDHLGIPVCCRQLFRLLHIQHRGHSARILALEPPTLLRRFFSFLILLRRGQGKGCVHPVRFPIGLPAVRRQRATRRPARSRHGAAAAAHPCWSWTEPVSESTRVCLSQIYLFLFLRGPFHRESDSVERFQGTGHHHTQAQQSTPNGTRQACVSGEHGTAPILAGTGQQRRTL